VERLEARELLSISGFVWGGLHFDASQGVTPPDTIAAAGPTYIVEAVNSNLAFINRATQAATVQATTSFFTGTHTLVSDPSVSYDEATHKFIISVLDIDTTGLKETLDVAVSNGGDPTVAANWTKFTVNLAETASQATNSVPGNYGATVWGDFDRFGSNDQAYVWTVNMFTFATSGANAPINQNSLFDHVQVIAIDKSNLSNVHTVDLPGWDSTNQVIVNENLMPVKMHGTPTGPMWFAEETNYADPSGSASSLRLVDVNNILTAAPGDFHAVDVTVPTYQFTPVADTSDTHNHPWNRGDVNTNAQQLGTADVMQTNDTRLLSASWRVVGGQEHLVLTQTVTDTTGVAKARWYDFNTGNVSAPTLYQSGVIDPGPGIFTYFPSADIDPVGDIGMTYIESSPSEYVSMYVTGKHLGDTTMQPGVLVTAGTTPYTFSGFLISEPSPHRAGDFSGTEVDVDANGNPINGFVSANEYATTVSGGFFGNYTGVWGTSVVTYALSPVATPSLGALSPAQTTEGQNYNGTIPISNGTGTFTLQSTSGLGSLTAAINGSNVVISGTAPAASTVNFSVTIQDSTGATATNNYTLTVNAAPTLGTLAPPQASVGQSYSGTIAIGNGTGPFSLQSTSGLGGLTAAINGSNVVISGTPSAAGTVNFSVTVQDAAGATVTNNYALSVVNLALGTLAPAQTTTGQSYSGTVPIVNGTGPFTIQNTSGLGGLTAAINGSNVVISGTAPSAGTVNFSITVQDSTGATATNNYALTVNAAPTLGALSPAQTTAGQSYSGTIAISNGTGPFALQSTSGLGGLTAAISGGNVVISGTAPSAGTVNFSVTVQDSAGATVTNNYSLTVNATPTLGALSPATATAGQSYSGTIPISNGTGPFALQSTSGLGGLTAAISGSNVVISGTPSAAGTVNFSVTVQDSAGATATNNYTLTVSAPTVRNIEDFDTSHTYHVVFPPLTFATSAAASQPGTPGDLGLINHPGNDWVYRDDSAAQVGRGDTITAWVQFHNKADGSAYFAFGATSTPTGSPLSTYSLVVVPNGNNNQLQLQQNSFTSRINSTIGSHTASGAIQANHWYRLVVAWGANGAITGRLYDGNSTTPLNTVSAQDSSVLGFAGGIGFHATGNNDKYWDSVTAVHNLAASASRIVQLGGGTSGSGPATGGDGQNGQGSQISNPLSLSGLATFFGAENSAFQNFDLPIGEPSFLGFEFGSLGPSNRKDRSP
jgi:hypothetical protein